MCVWAQLCRRTLRRVFASSFLDVSTKFTKKWKFHFFDIENGRPGGGAVLCRVRGLRPAPRDPTHSTRLHRPALCVKTRKSNLLPQRILPKAREGKPDIMLFILCSIAFIFSFMNTPGLFFLQFGKNSRPMFWQQKLEAFFPNITQVYEAHSKTWWYKILALKL